MFLSPWIEEVSWTCWQFNKLTRLKTKSLCVKTQELQLRYSFYPQMLCILKEVTVVPLYFKIKVTLSLCHLFRGESGSQNSNFSHINNILFRAGGPQSRITALCPPVRITPVGWLLLFSSWLPGQRLQAAAGSDGESPWQRERREDPVQPPTTRAGQSADSLHLNVKTEYQSSC